MICVVCNKKKEIALGDKNTNLGLCWSCYSTDRNTIYAWIEQVKITKQILTIKKEK